MYEEFIGKSILVTGACGTVGSELIKQLLSKKDFSPKEIIGIDNNESQIFFLDQKYLNDVRVNFYISDIRDVEDLIKKMSGVDIVFHCAALKHVVLSERSPEQAIQTNIVGVQNVISAAVVNKVSKVIFTSSDKAVNPTNVMGTSKLMGERLMTAANSNQRNNNTIFASTRFGNVLGSSGSVVPIFHKQIAQGGPVTLTHYDMTRFVMSIEEAVDLVLASAALAKGGEVFITKMPVLKIIDLARAMIVELAEKYGFEPSKVKIEEIGTKPGEKLYEELMSEEEIRRAVELQNYYSVLPAFRGIYNKINYDYSGLMNNHVNNPYVSSKEKFMKVSEIQKMLKESNLLDIQNYPSDKRYWLGDKEFKN